MPIDTENRQAWDVIVIGAGAAGLFAAGSAAARNRRVLLLEKNSKLGVKILMSGGTRCNITHDMDWQGIAEAFGGHQGRFLKFSLASLSPDMVIDFFRQRGVETKVESTGKIFPVSDRAIDVRDALVTFARTMGATIQAGCAVNNLRLADNRFYVDTESTSFSAESIVLTSGGQSYPGCGTTGDGYAWLKALGHSIVPTRPALVPVRIDEEWPRSLKGITLDNVQVSVVSTTEQQVDGPRCHERGSFLFTHFGASGPAVMNVSRAITDPLNNFAKILKCDWLPDQPLAEFERGLTIAKTSSGSQFVETWLADQLPKRLAAILCQLSNAQETRLAELSREQRILLTGWVKSCELAIDGTLGFKKAEVTAGGVCLDEVDSKTLQSKLVPGLYLAGEILDVDGPIGGYNFQAAFSTGSLAGQNA